MSLSSVPRRPMTTPASDRVDRAAINRPVYQKLTDTWNTMVPVLSRELELLCDTIPHRELESRISSEFIPRAERVWDEQIRCYLTKLWDVPSVGWMSASGKSSSRYSREQFVGAVFLFATRRRVRS